MPSPKTYTLLYKSYSLGTVTELSSEWPRPSGTVELDIVLKELNDDTKHLFAYIDYSIKAALLLENRPEEEYDKYVEENESQYLDLIDSKDWFMLDENGKRNNIVIPIFSENNEIVWTAFK